jgi:hypothetical protein
MSFKESEVSQKTIIRHDTNFMGKDPTWEADSRLADYEFLAFYGTVLEEPAGPTLSQINSVRNFTPYPISRFNIIYLHIYA